MDSHQSPAFPQLLHKAIARQHAHVIDAPVGQDLALFPATGHKVNLGGSLDPFEHVSRVLVCRRLKV